MPNFKYTVKNQEGKTVIGEADAKSKENLIELLRKQNFTIIYIGDEHQAQAKKTQLAKKVKLEDLVIFSRQLATMVEGYYSGKCIRYFKPTDRE